MQFCFRAAAVLAVVSVALSALVGQPPAPGGSTPPKPVGTAATPAKPQLGVKVLRLERAEPEAVVASLHALLEHPDAEAAQPANTVAPVPGGPKGGFGGGGGSNPVPAGGQPGGGAIGCFLGAGGPAPAPVWRATTQPRTRSVVVRGADHHQKVAADLVAILDRPADAPLPRLQVVTAFALKHATAEEVADVIRALSFDDVRVVAADERVLAAVGRDELATITELIKGLDVPATTDRKPAEGKSPP